MVQLAKKNGKEVDENKLKSEMEKCGNQGKYYCTWEYFSVSTSEEQKKRRKTRHALGEMVMRRNLYY